MNFTDKLNKTIAERQSMLCVGLDTVMEKIPSHLRTRDEPLFEFNKAIIDATADLAAAFKVNTAFYEAYGIEGWKALKKTFDYLPAGAIKIADAKRGDIGNSSRMYSRSLFDWLGADAITVNPLMGGDSVAPFLVQPERGVFFLCLTSNPGSADLQHFSDGRQKLYQRVIELVQSWNRNNNCGLVVGATHPHELARVRGQAPELPFLIPGIGAQGGDLEESVAAGSDMNGLGAIFNSSRAIIYAGSGNDFAEAARTAAQETVDQLNIARQKGSKG